MKQLLFQTTGAHTATPASPDLVVAGTIACFNAATGAVSAMNGAAPAKFILVQGHATVPIITPVITVADMLANVQLYVNFTHQLMQVTGVPVGPSGGDNYWLKVTGLTDPFNRTDDTEPRSRSTYEIQVPASQTDEDSIYALAAMVNDDPNRKVNAGGNKIITGDIATTSGSVGITITDPTSGLTATYIEVYAVNVNTTAAAFVTSYAAIILAAFGIVVTNPSGATITLTGRANTNSGQGTDYTAVDDGTGGCTWTPSTTEATTLFIEARVQGFQFSLTKSETMDDATIAVNAAHVEGSGTPQQVLRIEQENQGAFGNYYREGAQPLLPDTYTGSNNFDIYTVRMLTNADRAVNKSNIYHEIVLCIVDGLGGDLDTFLGI